STCGLRGSATMIRKARRDQKTYRYYGCSTHHLKGSAGCENSLVWPMDKVNQSVLAEVQNHILNEATILGVIERTIQKLNDGPKTVAEQRTTLDVESKKLAKEIDRLYQHLVDGLDGVKEQIATREARLRVITAELSKLDGVAQVASLDKAGIGERLGAELAVWRKSVAREIPVARQILRKLFMERLVMTPNGIAVALDNGVLAPGADRVYERPMPGAARFYTWSVSVNFGPGL